MECIVKIRRIQESDSSTISDLLLNGKKIGCGLELPWEQNKENISRIPPGSYSAFVRKAENSRWSYNVLQLNNVAERTAIQIHRGNHPWHTNGCILAGKTSGTDVVWNSKTAMDEIMASAEQAGSIKVEVVDDFKQGG